MESDRGHKIFSDYAYEYEDVIRELYKLHKADTTSKVILMKEEVFNAELDKTLDIINNEKRAFDLRFNDIISNIDSAINKYVAHRDNSFSVFQIDDLAEEFFAENRIQNAIRSLDDYFTAYKDSYLKALEKTVNTNENLSKLNIYAQFKEAESNHFVAINDEGSLINSENSNSSVDMTNLIKNQLCSAFAKIIEQNYELENGTVPNEAVMNLIDRYNSSAFASALSSMYQSENKDYDINSEVKTIIEIGRVPDNLDDTIREWLKEENIKIPQREITFEMIEAEAKELMALELNAGQLFFEYDVQYNEYMNSVYKKYEEKGDLVPDKLDFDNQMFAGLDEMGAEKTKFIRYIDDVVEDIRNTMRAYLTEGDKDFNTDIIIDKALDDCFANFSINDIVRSHEDYLNLYKNSIIKGFSDAINSHSGLQKLHIRSVCDEKDAYSISFHYFNTEWNDMLNSDLTKMTGQEDVSISSCILSVFESEIKKIIERDLQLEEDSIDKDDIHVLYEGNRRFSSTTGARIIDKGSIPDDLKDDIKSWVREDLKIKLPEDKKRNGYER